MTAVRAVLGVLGVAGAAWGAWLLLGTDPSGIVSTVLWAGGAVVVHDLLLAPLVAAVGVLVVRATPAAARRGVLAVLAGWAVVTLAVANVLSGQGGKPDNPTLLTGDYLPWWLVLTALTGAVVAALVVRARRAP